MFGFSLMKLLFTIAVVIVVWLGFKWIGRRNEMAVRRPPPPGNRNSAGRPGAPGPGEEAVADMVACATCGDFVLARGTRSCGRDNCPYPG